MFKDLELNLTVTNVFDQSLPLYYARGISSRLGFSNGNTFGRLEQIGFREKF